MVKVLAINAGSSSFKFQLFEVKNEKLLCVGLVERIGTDESVFSIKYNDQKHKETLVIKDHASAVQLLVDSLIKYSLVEDIDEIVGIGHRLVHGGELFNKSIIVTDEVVDKVKTISNLAPLHNPANLGGYEACKKVLPKAKHVFVFDTAFHATMPREEYLYPLPYEYYEKYGVRRYGFHGTSHYYVSNEYITRNNLKESKLITCHIGSGASIAAVKNGKSIATSMGFTPLSGIMMGTRCGDVDPAIITYMKEQTGLSAHELIEQFNKDSGLKGVSRISNDSREIEAGVEAGNEDAILANDKFINTIVERIGSYFIKLGGCDAIIFTAGIGENSKMFRKDVVDKISEALGAKIDLEKNNVRGKYAHIAASDSKVDLVVIPTNEELVIARDTIRLLKLGEN